MATQKFRTQSWEIRNSRISRHTSREIRNSVRSVDVARKPRESREMREVSREFREVQSRNSLKSRNCRGIRNISSSWNFSGNRDPIAKVTRRVSDILLYSYFLFYF